MSPEPREKILLDPVVGVVGGIHEGLRRGLQARVHRQDVDLHAETPPGRTSTCSQPAGITPRGHSVPSRKPIQLRGAITRRPGVSPSHAPHHANVLFETTHALACTISWRSMIGSLRSNLTPGTPPNSWRASSMLSEITTTGRPAGPRDL